MTTAWRGFLLGAALAGLLLASCAAETCEGSPEEPTPPGTGAPSETRAAAELVLGLDVELRRTLTPAETASFRLVVPRGHYVELELEQRHVDVVARVVREEAGEAATVAVADRPIRDQGSESLLFVAGARNELRLAASEGDEKRSAGEVVIRVGAFRPATAEDRSRAAAMAIFSRAEELIWDASGERQQRRALALYRSAFDAFGEVGESELWRAEIHDRIGRLLDDLGRRGEAVEHFRAAAGLYDEVGRPGLRAASLHQAGLALFRDDRPGEAVAYLEAAVPLRRQTGNRRGEAISWIALAQAHQIGDRFQQALDAYAAALHLLETLPEPSLRAYCRHDLGVLYATLGRPEHAAEHLEAAVAAWEELGQEARLAASLNQLGDVRLELAEEDGEKATEAAERAFRRALDLRHAVGAERGEASTLANLGRVAERRGEMGRARDLYLEALEILEGMGHPLSEARVLRLLGEVEAKGERVAEAVAHLRRAAELSRRVGDPTGEAEALAALARAEHGRGRLEAAAAAGARALELVETVRPRVLSPDLRTRFFARVQGYYDAQIAVLLELHGLDGSAGHAARALEMAERARARSLLDLLRQRGETAAEDIAGGLGESRPASLGEIRSAVEGRPGSVLLVYRLLEEGSVLWALSADGLAAHRLAGRREIESAALRAHGLLARSHRREVRAGLRAALCALSDAVLPAGLAGLGEASSLVVVPDGALHYVPFAVLPRPDGDCSGGVESMLLARHQVRTAPSASVLVRLAAGKEGGARPEAQAGSLAVVADPVFSPQDPRVERTEMADPSRRPGSALRRLEASGREAEALLALATGPARGFLGFDASKERVLAGSLSGHRHVHFATHALVDASRPERSGIVLSQVDRRGRPVDGMLRTLDLLRLGPGGLDLDAELVVLSACETALGEEVRGEGMVGLSRAFLAAGAESLVVSLWKVSDGGTAALMERFYRSLYEEGLSAPAALRRAQLEMAADETWSAPYFWAGFVAMGSVAVGSADADRSPRDR